MSKREISLAMFALSFGVGLGYVLALMFVSALQ